MTMRKDRRRLLGIIAATGGAALMSSISAQVGRERLSLKAALLGVLSDPQGVGDIGRAYLNLFPSEANARQLVSLIVERHPGAFGPAVSLEEARALLQQAVREDFHEEKTVELNGWVVSRTEARLCALACLA